MYCSHCGTEVQAGQSFCPSCGKPLGPLPAAPAPPSRLKNHLQLVGILWIAYSALKLIGALIVLLVGRVILMRIHMPMEAGFVPGLVTVVGWGLLVVAAVGVATGWGLLQREPWARIVALVLAVLGLFQIPFGTALGIYTLWVLLPAESGRDYERLAGGA